MKLRPSTWLLAILVLCSVSAQSPSGENVTEALKKARQRLLRGNYVEAREQFQELVKEPKFRAAAVLGLSQSYQAEGEYEQALAVIENALKESPKVAALLARKAELLYLRGRWDDAEKTAALAITLAENQFLARWVRGQVLRDRGRLKEADEEFRWFIRAYNNSDISDPEDLLRVGLAALERARWHKLKDQFQFVLDEIFAETVKMDKDFWPGEFESAWLFLEKYNKADATRNFDRALAINPQAAEIYAGKGKAAFQRLDLQDAENFADRALKINPRLTEALRLKADLHLFAGEVASARKEVDKALAVNPREEATLARLAICHFLQKQKDPLQKLFEEVARHNPSPGIFYQEFADRLEERKYFLEAEKYFRLAMDLQPKFPWAQNGLGLLYMRLGKEDEARASLEKAFEADPFNVRVGNSLKVLDHLAKYSTLKTDHFLLRYDPANDKVLARFMAKYLEEMHKELADKFQYQPRDLILVEVFNKHEMFSGRIVALPDLHTIGACSGRIMAMVSPRDKSKKVDKPFNWVRVLRHELVHIFNLEQTGFQVPHWLTEGLAVQNEGNVVPPRWHRILAERLQAGKIFNLDNILLGFARPSSPEEWHLAYYQSLLYVEHLEQQHGPKAVGLLLAAYAEGLDTEAALKKACQVDKAVFEKSYRAFLAERAKKVKIRLPQQNLTLRELKEMLAKDPANLDIQAQFAEQWFLLGDRKQASKLAEQVLKEKSHPLAGYVKARILNDAGESSKALGLLESVVDDQTTEIKPLIFLGKLQFEARKFKEAAQTYLRGRKLEPDEPAWLLQLAKIYYQTGEEDKLIDILKEITRSDPDDLLARKKLALLLLKGNPAQAENYARQALEIDVLDKEAQETLFAALKAQNKDQEMSKLKKLLED